jgi:hypothetical protein
MILYAGDYESTLKDGLIQKLNWLEEEFSFLFDSKKHEYSQKERALANQIVNSISECALCFNNVELKELLTDTLKSIRSIYPALF